ncbi:MAG TPA: hypothetical protein VLM42_11415, partial [Bryobacteraceae bacterium]|nr:hypothetical protein [Bryobacteraceae bacterium]
MRFISAKVPGTVASVLREHKAWHIGDRIPFDSSEHWFRCRFEAEPIRQGEEIVLRFGGIATVSEVWLNGEAILKSNSMFASHEVAVSALIRERNELLIVCRSLTAAMREQRRQPPLPRWRTRVVSEQSLRWFRTTLLGRAPGFAPEPAPVGPWRPVTLGRRSGMVIDSFSRRASLDGSTGNVEVHLQGRCLQSSAIPISGRLLVGDMDAAFTWREEGGRYYGRAVLSIPNVLPWWPHTHGLPALYPLRAELRLADGSVTTFEDVPVGFRSMDAGAEPAGDGGIALTINGTSVFCRGVVWTPPDPTALTSPADVLRQRLRLLRDGGFNLIRLAGTTFYECENFHRLCDELGLMVWQ